MTGIQFSVQPKDCYTFKTLNPNISINIFGYEDKVVYPIRITDKKIGRTHGILVCTPYQ